ncbi:hypothetical protein Gogos_004476 [Gossypium gossypioides]|uniref:Uncharacterized protein n=1 Tax=Gossypium gossypioides TaxID=34282 RepID=A0A7J9CGG7_GOSGO|nr:hypothetical protein [Gossypium gossypioides]
MSYMVVRVQSLSKKNFDERFSILSLPHISVGFQPWWNSNEQKIAHSLPQNISLKVETPSKLHHNAKHLDHQLPDQELTSAQAICQSHPEMGVTRGSNPSFYSSDFGQDESCGKDIEGQMKPINNPNTVFSPSNPNYNLSMASAQYPYTDVCIGGLFTPYGQPAINLTRFRPRWQEEVRQHDFHCHLILQKMALFMSMQNNIMGFLGEDVIVQSLKHKTNLSNLESPTFMNLDIFMQ